MSELHYCLFCLAKKKVNVTRHKAKPTGKVRQVMRKKMEFEYTFYYYVKRRFDKLYKEINSKGSRRSQTKNSLT